MIASSINPVKGPTYRRWASVLCGMCILGLLMYTGVGTVAAQETTTNITIDGEQLKSEDNVVVLNDPNANITVTADAPIELIELRVNGDVYRSYRPNSTTFDRSVTLDLDPNENTVEVITKSDTVTTFKSSITKHTAAPRVEYTSPFSTTVKGGPNNTVNVTSGQVTLAGNLHTVVDVKSIRIERTSNYGPDESSSDVDRKIHRISNPGESFSQELLLVDGTNNLTAEYTDTLGRTNTDRFVIDVDDESDPTINITVADESYTDTASIGGTVQDETKLKRVEINRTSNNGSQVLMLSANAKPNPDKLKYSFDTTVELYDDNDDNEFKITAEDAAGNIRNQTFVIKYEPEPEVNITNATINLEGKTVHLAGTVSQAEISRVTIETFNTSTGERLDLDRVYDTETFTNTVSFDKEFRASAKGTIVAILVSYRSGQYSTSITPEIPDSQKETNTNNGTETTDNTTSVQSEATNRTVQNTSETKPDNQTSVETNLSSETESQPDTTPNSPTLLPVRTRDAFGGIVVVGGAYILGHWV
ncbi:hypothetical protein [Halorubrum sp. SD683]|uniref:hypothetical protein n=1 Tax=Halorubrum sp. SD683 TaxID=1855873 RepID=UPI00117B4E25|nr:hypothetical protein [Halorubrum sp. SD683]